MTCCVPYCSSYAGKAKLLSDLSVSFHEFPVTDIREAWIKAISREGKEIASCFDASCLICDGCHRRVTEAFYEGPNKTLWQPHETAKVCSIHFRLEDYKEGTKGRRLKPNAVPSIFPGYPSYMQRSAERIRSKASDQPRQRYTEAFPQAALCPKSKKRLLCDAPAAENRETCTKETSKCASETTGGASTTPVHRTKVIVREPLRTTRQTVPATQQNNSRVPASEESRRPAILRLVPAERALLEQQQPSVVEEECSIPSDQHALCIEEHRTFGTQTGLTGVTLGALCEEIKLLKQRCSQLQGQLNDALTENCYLKTKLRSSQGSCGT